MKPVLKTSAQPVKAPSHPPVRNTFSSEGRGEDRELLRSVFNNTGENDR